MLKYSTPLPLFSRRKLLSIPPLSLSLFCSPLRCWLLPENFCPCASPLFLSPPSCRPSTHQQLFQPPTPLHLLPRKVRRNERGIRGSFVVTRGLWPFRPNLTGLPGRGKNPVNLHFCYNSRDLLPASQTAPCPFPLSFQTRRKRQFRAFVLTIRSPLLPFSTYDSSDNVKGFREVFSDASF